MPQGIRTNTRPPLYPLLTQKERISAWERAKGMWKYRTSDPLRELQKMRNEWNRTLSSLR